MPDTGAPYNIPYVESTDLVSGWPAISLDVANAIVAALDGVKVNKKIEAFTASGTWTVPAGVTYAIAHMVGGGGGIGTALTGGDGGDSSVAFASGTVTAAGGKKGPGSAFMNGPQAGAANSGFGANSLEFNTQANSNVYSLGNAGARIVAGAAVTPAASITVTVGAGGSAGTSGAAGGSGYVYIEYYE